MNIRSFIIHENGTATFLNDDGTVSTLSAPLLHQLREQIEGLFFRDRIRFIIDEYDGDTISMGSYDGTVDEFINEVVDWFQQSIDEGRTISDDEIQTAVLDIADTYGIRIDDD